MSTMVVEDRIAELDRKLDFLVEEMTELKRMRTSAEDLVADLTLVAKDAMGNTVEALGDTPLQMRDLVQLLQTVLFNVRSLETALQQLGSAADFLQDAQPIVRDVFHKAVSTSQSLQEKGYFAATAAGFRVTDALVRSHSAADWQQVESSVPQFVGFLRELTRPEVLQALEAIIHGFGRVQATLQVEKSAFALARDMNSPDARRGLAIVVEFLKVVGARSVPATSSLSTAQPTSKR